MGVCPTRSQALTAAAAFRVRLGEPLVVLLILRLWPVQENVRPITYLRGGTWKPLGGSSFSRFTSTPAFFHCSTHDSRPSPRAGSRGHSTRSTIRPKTFST